MKEYLNMNYLEEVTEFKLPDEKYYIPHHSAFWPKSNSTLLRDMFSSISLTSAEKSLNCLQFDECTLQDDLR